ncbi:hypothetical protein [Paracidovorax avenae]|nr:hypothetical protein [Paracidovorax avenae]
MQPRLYVELLALESDGLANTVRIVFLGTSQNPATPLFTDKT